jgi:hypothetical protein
MVSIINSKENSPCDGTIFALPLHRFRDKTFESNSYLSPLTSQLSTLT